MASSVQGLEMADCNVETREEFLFKGRNIECRKELFGQGFFMYGGCCYEKGLNFEQILSGRIRTIRKESIIRRIRKTDCVDNWEYLARKFKQSNSKDENFDPNFILQIFAYEDGKDDWRYFALEPYISTLYHSSRGMYEGPPLPSEPQVINQLISGIKYLHSLDYAHGDINPLNVLITQHQRIKLSDFGLSQFCYLKCSFEGRAHIPIPDICQRKYWLLMPSDKITNPDVITDTTGYVYPKEKNDIFAVGCLIVFLLTKGVHPFGHDLISIVKNMEDRNPINLKELSAKHAELYLIALTNMIQQPKNKLKWWREAVVQFKDTLELKIDSNILLGEGSFGKVYKGMYKGVHVAVKKIYIENELRRNLIEREKEEHEKLEHDNVLKLLAVCPSDDNKTLDLVLELCKGTLSKFWEKKYEMPRYERVLYQIANGLHYIHSKYLVHRDVKPGNILVSMTKPVTIKLSDFGFAKKTSPTGIFSQSGIKGTQMWMAPEMLDLLNDSYAVLPQGTTQSDTFAAGCVFLYVLEHGLHPFGSDSVLAMSNILDNLPVELIRCKKNLKQGDLFGLRYFLYDLIYKMIKREVVERIKMPDVMNELTKILSAKRKFKFFENSIPKNGNGVSCFHPKLPVLARVCGNKMSVLTAMHSSIPFSNWNENEICHLVVNFEEIENMIWNVDGTQLALISYCGCDVIVLSYRNNTLLSQMNQFSIKANRIEWNPIEPNVFATFDYGGEKICFFNCVVDKKYLCSIECKKGVLCVKWISEYRVALGLRNGSIELWEIDEMTTSAPPFKQFHHGRMVNDGIIEMIWNERTKYLTVCSYDGLVKIWAMDSDKPIYNLEFTRKCWSFACPNAKKIFGERIVEARKSPDNFIFACGLDDGRIVIWTPLVKKQKTRIINQHVGIVESLSFSPDGRFLASVGIDNKLIIWSTKDWCPVFISEVELMKSNGELSWMSSSDPSSSSSNAREYKLTYNSRGDKVRVLEYAVCQN